MMPRLAYRDHLRARPHKVKPSRRLPPAIADADGLASLSFSYQWQAGNTDAISSATGGTFVLNPRSSRCKTITVTVSPIPMAVAPLKP